MKKIFLTALVVAMMCGDMVAAENTVESKNGLEEVTPKEIYNANPELVKLISPLYRYVHSESFNSGDVDKNLEWMAQYRNKLVKYYDDNKLGADTVDYKKAYVVTKLAKEEYVKAYADVYKDARELRVLNALLTFELYTAFDEVLEFGSRLDEYEFRDYGVTVTERAKKEFKAWDRVAKKYVEVFDRSGYLRYWFPVVAFKDENMLKRERIYAENKIMEIRTKIYQKESSCAWICEGLPEETAIEIFKKSVKKAVNSGSPVPACEAALTGGEIPEEDIVKINNRAKYLEETKIRESELYNLVDQWLIERWDWIEHYEVMGEVMEDYDPNTGEILTKMAALISNI